MVSMKFFLSWKEPVEIPRDVEIFQFFKNIKMSPNLLKTLSKKISNQL